MIGAEESIGQEPSEGDDLQSLLRGFGFWLYNPHFLDGVSEERRPWIIRRERSPGRFCPALLVEW
jgi:hypothetical protein